MISFDMNKPKSLSMPILVEGIDQKTLDFKFIIEVNGISYGFSAMHEDGSIKFNLPALDDIVKHLVPGIYEARLEASSITQGDSGYFMMPWSDKINVKQSVSVSVPKEPVVENEETEPPVEKKVRLKIASIFSESDSVDEIAVEECKDEKKPKKSTKLSKFMDK